MEIEEDDETGQLTDMTLRLKKRIAKVEKFVNALKNGHLDGTKSDEDDSSESMIEEGERVLKMTIPTLAFLRIPRKER